MKGLIEMSLDLTNVSIVYAYLKDNFKAAADVLKNNYSVSEPPFGSPKLQDLVREYSAKRKLKTNCRPKKRQKYIVIDISSEDSSDSSNEEVLVTPKLRKSIQYKTSKHVSKASVKVFNSSEDSFGIKTLSQQLSNKDFSFKCLPKFKVIQKLIETEVIENISDKRMKRHFCIVFESDSRTVFESNFVGFDKRCKDLQLLLRRKDFQIQLRFSHSTELETKDCIPEHLCINVNGKPIFQYNSNEEMNRPFDLSRVCGLGRNLIEFWMCEPNYTFLMPSLYEISIVSYETPESFRHKLLQNRHQLLDSNSTKQLIRDRIGGMSGQIDEEIYIIDPNLEVSLICPLSYKRLEIPCRTYQCKHIECFDAYAFFRTNEWRYLWLCPICKVSAEFESLRIDSYLTEVLNKLENKVTKIVFNSDISYTPIN